MRLRPKAKARLILIAFVLAVAAWWLFVPPSFDRKPVTVEVPRGAGIAAVSRTLATSGLARDARAVRALAMLSGNTRPQEGTYRFRRGSSTLRILTALQRGKSRASVRVTFPEGLTLRQTADRAGSEIPGIKADVFERIASREGGSFKCSVRLPDNLEGYLYPDTYVLPIGISERTVIQQMVEGFDKKVIRELEPRERNLGDRLTEAVITASLIEREAAVAEDRPLISAVIRNRLKIGMRLQIDATVQYVIGHRSRLLYRDLEVNSPYNTYRNTGLPPGPICSPGLPCIEAALNPADVPYLYYVARPDGSHVFTETLNDHNRATDNVRNEAGN